MRRGLHGGELRTWSYRRVLRNYLPGESDTWDEEWRDIRNWSTPEEWDRLIQDLDENGIEIPILLGGDGRVWDGHHRLWWAMTHDYELVPVEVITEPDGAV